MGRTRTQSSSPSSSCLGLLLHRTRRSWRPAVELVTAYAVAVLAHAIVAAAVERARPPATDWLVPADGWAYPSGHTTQVTALCLALLLVGGPRVSGRVRIAAAAAATTVVLSVAVSRVYLGVHWMTDVLGGLVLGVATVAALAAAARTRHDVVTRATRATGAQHGLPARART